MDDFQNDINSYQSSINTLNTTINQNTQDIATLEREKTELAALVRKYKSEISERTSEHRACKQQINEAKLAQGEIRTLKSYAVSTKANVTEALPNLHNIKSSLEQCSTLVKERSLEVTVSSTTTERWTRTVPIIGGSVKKSKDFKRQQIMTQVSDVLNKIHNEIPLLLPSNSTKFLDIKPWDHGSVSVRSVSEPMPDLCYH